MQTVGIRELKAHLGDYIRRAASGEIVVITDRGKPVVELRVIDPELAGILQLVSSGREQWSGEKPVGLRGERIELRGESISQTVSRMRDEDAERLD